MLKRIKGSIEAKHSPTVPPVVAVQPFVDRLTIVVAATATEFRCCYADTIIHNMIIKLYDMIVAKPSTRIRGVLLIVCNQQSNQSKHHGLLAETTKIQTTKNVPITTLVIVMIVVVTVIVTVAVTDTV